LPLFSGGKPIDGGRHAPNERRAEARYGRRTRSLAAGFRCHGRARGAERRGRLARAGEGEAVGTPTAHASGRPAGGWLTQGFELTGADLFRLNCRACHGPEGKGARSGIPPLGGALEKAPAESGAMGGEIRVRHRLVEGGRVMPNFVHLDAEETNLLIAHLRTLGKPAGGATAPAKTLRQSALRVGEHVVKATCQVCHDAAAGPERMPADAAVPTIADFTAKYSVGDFLRKTRAGSAEAGAAHGRMPRFGYLTTEELEAAYVYLIAFPPQPGPK
jgi:mono/diheme cytochrome c family protein